MNALFNIGTLKLTGYNREKLPYERQIDNVDLSCINHPYELSYSDVIDIKKKQLINSDLLKDGVLFGEIDLNLFQTMSANHGWNFLSFRSGDYVITHSIELPKPSRLIRVYTETNINKLIIKMRHSDSEFKEVDDYQECDFKVPISEVIIRMENKTNKTIDLNSLGIFI